MRRLVLSVVTALPIVLPPANVFAIDQLSVAPQDQVCNVDDDCVIVSTRCDACECGAPVNKVHEQAYVERYRALCENYHGAVCRHRCPTPFTVCRDHQCVLSASPSNIELAHSAAKAFCSKFEFPAEKIRELDGPPLQGPVTLERAGRHVVSYRWLGGGRGDYIVQVETDEQSGQIIVYGGYGHNEFGPWVFRKSSE